MPRNGDSLADLLAKVNLSEHFERIENGKWTCIKQIGFNTKRGRIDIGPGSIFTIGTNFMGVDLAFVLETEYQRRQKPANGETR
jgi:hypothetical protein